MIVITPPAGGSAAATVDVPGALWMPTGAKIETTSRLAATINDRPGPVSGQLWLTPLETPLKAGVTYTSITFWTTDGVTTPTHQWFCLVRQSGRTVARATVDDTTTAWPGYTRKTLNLSTPYVPVTDEAAYAGIMVEAATVGGMMGAGSGIYVVNDVAPKLHGGSTSGLTTPLADGTVVAAISGEAHSHYAYVS